MWVVFINKSKSYEISNQMFFKFFILFWKQKINWLLRKYCKVKLFSGIIFHSASKEVETYLEPSQTSMREKFWENS